MVERIESYKMVISRNTIDDLFLPSGENVLNAVTYGHDVPWRVWFRCPCGCGDLVMLRLTGMVGEDDKPKWELSGIPDAPTLSPSVLNPSGCQSHYFIRDGKVIWA